MAIAWITRNAEGIVRVWSVVEFTRPEILAEWSKDGRMPELVDYGDAVLIINRQLPLGATVLRRLEPK